MDGLFRINLKGLRGTHYPSKFRCLGAGSSGGLCVDNRGMEDSKSTVGDLRVVASARAIKIA